MSSLQRKYLDIANSPSKSSPIPIQFQALMEPLPISHLYIDQPLTAPAPVTATSSSNIESPISAEKEQEIIDILFKNAMNGNWEAVISAYRTHKSVVQKAKITRAEETALHEAISNDRNEVVKQLLDIIDSNEIKMMKNNRDENPLHLAASMGQVEICRWIVEKDMELIGTRNEDGETPLFLAALHGKKGAFYVLHPPCPLNPSSHLKHDVTHCKRSIDGNTILHVAILGEYFELAFQIINWYPELIKYKNVKGQSALHYLAQNPSAFRSGCHLGPLDDFIYRCLIIDPIKVEMPSDYVDKRQSHISNLVPENYRTCSDLLKMFIKPLEMFIKAMVHSVRGWKMDAIKDAAKELLPVQCTLDDAAREARHMSTSRRPYPPNYLTFFRFLQFAFELFLFILGLGFFEVRKIKEKKRKHTLTLQVMTSLISLSNEWEYMGGGSTPLMVDRPDGLKEVPQDEPITSNQDMPTRQKDQQSQNVKKSKIEEIITEMTEMTAGRKIQVQAEMTRPNVYNLQKLLISEEDGEKKGSPLLTAAKIGVKEMVEEILNVFPVAIRDVDEEKKNVVLLAVENKHPKIYNFLLTEFPPTQKENVYKKVDKDGNSALHLAATMGKNQPWRIPGAALQMQWELKWYKFIKSSMPRHFFTHRNKEHKTSRELFAETHVGMIKDGSTWLTNTSQSCSVVAALIATVGYASATTVPGGAKEGTGIPVLRGHPAFDLFTIFSLVALCLSVTSLTMFLSILTSRYQVTDFLTNLPTKLILGLTSLFISIAAMLVSFCAGHFFDLGDRLRQTAFPIYVITCLPVTIFAVAQFPLYLDLIKSTIVSVPKRSYEITSI